ncbi:MAG: type II toxin-antitoxin system RelE/ParE family toxin [Bauldia sp.]
MYDTVAENSGNNVADAIYRRLDRAIERLRMFPESGVPHPDRDIRYRSVTVASWSIWYSWNSAIREVEIVRILHGRMNPDGHLPDDLPPA